MIKSMCNFEVYQRLKPIFQLFYWPPARCFTIDAVSIIPAQFQHGFFKAVLG